jgi:hypothetical protein
LACSHVSTGPTAPNGDHPLRLVVDDKEIRTRLVVLACVDCCRQFKLSTDQPVPGDTFWDESSFPYVAPICSRCAVAVGFVAADDKDAV